VPGSFHSLSVVDTGKPDVSGRRLDYVERYGADTVVLVLARTASDALTALMKRIDAELAASSVERKKIRALLVMLTDEVGLEAKLKELADKHRIRHVSVSVADAAGPSSWRIARDADITVIVYARRKVEANHAFGKGELDDQGIDTVIAELPRLVRR
jgi:hypothetical protein